MLVEQGSTIERSPITGYRHTTRVASRHAQLNMKEAYGAPQVVMEAPPGEGRAKVHPTHSSPSNISIVQLSPAAFVVGVEYLPPPAPRGGGAWRLQNTG